MSLLDEIREQPQSAARFLDRQLGQIASISAAIVERDPSYVLIAARGSSDHAAIYGQYVLGIRNRLPVALAAPSTFSLFAAPPRLDGALVVGISQSGRSPDIVAVLDEAARQGRPTLAITNEPDSPLAVAAQHVIPLEAGPELAVAATKTYSAELLAIAALSAAMVAAAGTAGTSGIDDDAAQLHAVPDAIAGALSLESAARDAAKRAATARAAVVLGRGYEYGTAREWALKVQELANVFAHSWSGADFEHGPLALVEPGLPVWAIVSEDAAGDALAPLLARVRQDLGADVLAISRRPDLGAIEVLRPPAALAPWLQPIASIIPAQLFAAHVASAKGLDTEQPRTISKVTLTR
jgi:glucosamine--fructose-6-phosphate aminotransferase (isomerizing)